MYHYQYLYDFTTQLFEKIGCSKEDATVVAELLVGAELRNIPSHGFLRIPDYIKMWEAGRIKTNPNISVVRETLSTVVIDADSCFGMIAAKKAMNLAIEKAKTVGTCWIAIKNSTHFGIAGYYAMMALEHDMIGIAMTNANPLVAPTFSIDKMLGTNPFAVAIPTQNQPPFVADFATTPIARGKLDLMGKKGLKAPLGFVQDKDGNPSTNPDILKQGGAILPLGGDYEHGSHKGYCMGAIVDIFSSVFSGANFGPFVPPQVPYLAVKAESTGEGLGHFLGAMQIDAFQDADVFKSQMDNWITTFRNSKPAEGQEKVLIPGDPERESEISKKRDGIVLLPSLEEDIKQIATKYGLEFKA